MERKTFESEQYGVSFSLPVEMTVRDHLAFRSRSIPATEDGLYAGYWKGIMPLLEDWKCEIIPNPEELDIDKAMSLTMANIVNWVCNMAIVHFTEIDDVPPNS
jgi:hypothetical protein